MKNINRGVIASGVLNIVGMVFLYVIAFLFFKNIGISTETLGGVIVILLISLVPSFLWLTFFYLIDFEDREPILYVIAAFIGGCIAYYVLDQFFSRFLFNLPMWSLNGFSLTIPVVFFSKVGIPVLTIYLLERLFFYPSKIFNERVDGMMYGAFAAVGISVVIALREVFASPDISLYFLLYSLLIKVGIYSALGSFMGFFFGSAKYNRQKENLFFLFVVITSLIVMTAYSFLDRNFRFDVRTSMDFVTVLLTVGFLIILQGASFFLIRNSQKKYDPDKGEKLPLRFDPVSVVLVLVILAAGLVVRGYTGRNVNREVGNGYTVSVPASFREVNSGTGLAVFAQYFPAQPLPILLKINSQEKDESAFTVTFNDSNEKDSFDKSRTQTYRIIEEGFGISTHPYSARVWERTEDETDATVIISIVVPDGMKFYSDTFIDRIASTLNK